MGAGTASQKPTLMGEILAELGDIQQLLSRLEDKVLDLAGPFNGSDMPAPKIVSSPPPLLRELLERNRGISHRLHTVVDALNEVV